MARKWDNIRVQRVGGRGSNVDHDMGNLYSVKVSYATNSDIGNFSKWNQGRVMECDKI